MTKITSTIIVVLVLCMSSCSKILNDDKLKLARIENNLNSLRIDGYYFSEFESDQPRYRIYFLYKNGIALYGNSPYVSEILEEEEKIRSGEFYELVKDQKPNWGVYQIEGNEIKIERWYPSERPYRTFLEIGEIISDTSFVIKQFSDSDGGDPKIREELYHFNQLSPKPESTNVFIK